MRAISERWPDFEIRGTHLHPKSPTGAPGNLFKDRSYEAKTIEIQKAFSRSMNICSLKN
jgi:hypothetical protein